MYRKTFTNTSGKTMTSAQGGFANNFVIYTKIAYAKYHCRRVFGRRGFATILAHYNGSRAFANSFDINTYSGSLPSPSKRGYIN